MKTWLFTIVGACAFALVLVVAHDQLLVEYGDDSAYWLGKATPAVTWLLTLVLLYAVVDFFRTLHREGPSGKSVFRWALPLTVVAFLTGLLLSRNWVLEWLIERDMEVSFSRDEFLSVVVGIWSAFVAVIVIRLFVGGERNVTAPAQPATR